MPTPMNAHAHDGSHNRSPQRTEDDGDATNDQNPRPESYYKA
ncbi:MAG TPA: hypothetical protein VF026_26970 [Ktedonobacteraceae bacterium]